MVSVANPLNRVSVTCFNDCTAERCTTRCRACSSRKKIRENVNELLSYRSVARMSMFVGDIIPVSSTVTSDVRIDMSRLSVRITAESRQ